jgi:molybdopterin converting factor small subunit
MAAAVRVLFFAQYAEMVGRDEAVVAVQLPATIQDVVQRIRSELPGARALPAKPLAALNEEHALLETTVTDGDEVALLPPLAGG